MGIIGAQCCPSHLWPTRVRHTGRSTYQRYLIPTRIIQMGKSAWILLLRHADFSDVGCLSCRLCESTNFSAGRKVRFYRASLPSIWFLPLQDTSRRSWSSVRGSRCNLYSKCGTFIGCLTSARFCGIGITYNASWSDSRFIVHPETKPNHRLQSSKLGSDTRFPYQASPDTQLPRTASRQPVLST